MARERELLMLLARESRGSRGRDLCVRLLTSTDDAGAMQLVMPAVLGGELFHLLQDYGRMSEPGWSKWPSGRGHSWPPRAPQTAFEGLRLPSALGRRGLAPQTTAGSDGSSATRRASRHFRCV